MYKCDFLKNCIDDLGFEVSANGVHTSPNKVKAIVKWPTPSVVKEVRSFLDLASYYCKFIWGFSELANPLTNLTKRGIEWNWESEEKTAFLKLKTAKTTAPVL